jgi:alpha-1,2-mannosyltransferase
MAGAEPNAGFEAAGAAGAAGAARRPGLERWLQPAAVVLFALGVVGHILIPGATLGYDYEAYAAAAERLLAGQALYDTTVDVAGGFAIYLYPPPFAIAMVPFALLPEPLGMWLWLAGLVAAFLAGVALLPVRSSVRWAVVLLAGVSWPFTYSIKLGQVGPLLFLAFAVAWRFRDRPVALGTSIAAGALVKLQPALLFGWALVTGRWRAVAVGVGLGLAVAAVSAIVLGPQTWFDYVDLLRRVSGAVTTPQNLAPGAVAFQLGVPEATAGALQLAVMVVVVAVTVVAWFRLDDEASLVVTVAASQLLSPLLWDHYAMLLLLPVALLLERRQWWAIAIPLAGWLGPVAYPLMFAAGLLGPFLAARPRASRTARAAAPVGAAGA